MILSIIVSFAGSFCIGHLTNCFQSMYKEKHSDMIFVTDINYYDEIRDEAYITDTRKAAGEKELKIFLLISYAQFLFIPLWVILCIGVTLNIFYNREFKKPISILLNASKKISDNELDFSIDYDRNNEFGNLCNAFEKMRKSVYENNIKLWRNIEERKKLNSAFSHDLRTPLTVLKGYAEILSSYGDNLPEEKVGEIIAKMNCQIKRLEDYTYKMTSVQKLEDIVPEIKKCDTKSLETELFENGKFICKDKNFDFCFSSDTESIFADVQIINEIYENLLSNSIRYAKNSVAANISISNDILEITVSDDGKGFSEEALKNAVQPFYRDSDKGNHFGLGLYIVKILSEKCGGSVKITNTEKGARIISEILLENR